MSYKYIVYKMVMEQVYIEIHGMEERNLALGLNIFLGPSKIVVHGPFTHLTKSKTC